ncbi:nitrogen regulation protein NR(II) [Bdellovibrionota bacterium]
MSPLFFWVNKIRRFLGINENIQWYLFGRLTVITALFGLVLLYQLSQLSWNILSPALFPLYAVMFITYLFSIACSFLVSRVTETKKFIGALIVYDTLFITTLLYLSGTKESYFPFLYLVTITFAALLFARKGALKTAGLSAVCYTGLMIFDPLAHDSGFFINLVINNSAFFVVGLLAGYIADELKITGLKLFETKKEMKIIEDFNQAILDNVSVGLLTTNHAGAITSLNKAGEELLGKSFKTLQYHVIEDLLPEFNDLLKLFIKNNCAPDQPLEMRYKRERWEEEIYFDFAISKIETEGEKDGWIFVFQDRTELQETQEQLQIADKQAAIGQMVAGIAHEIRNPLASMSGSVEMLKQNNQIAKEDHKLMDIVGREIDRLNGLISELLDYTKPTDKRDDHYLLDELIYETIEELRLHRKYQESINIDIEIPGEKIEMRGDRGKIKQVFLNLFINACQAMGGKGELTISVSEAEDRVAITVSDTGIGIDADDLKKIFDPFFTTKPHGTGLGLAMVSKIIETHGGIINANSYVGKGTKFTIALPKPNVSFRRGALLKERAS